MKSIAYIDQRDPMAPIYRAHIERQLTGRRIRSAIAFRPLAHPRATYPCRRLFGHLYWHWQWPLTGRSLFLNLKPSSSNA